MFNTITSRDGESREVQGDPNLPIKNFFRYPLLMTVIMFVSIKKKEVKMPLFIDIHQDVPGLTTEALTEAHALTTALFRVSSSRNCSRVRPFSINESR